MTHVRTQAEFWDAPPRAALLLALGVAIGPHGLALLGTAVLDLVRPIVPVTLAVLGALVLRSSGRRFGYEVVPLAAAALALVALNIDAAASTALLMRAGRALLTCGPAALIGVAGLILLGRTTSATERRVFVLALLLVLGGVAEFAGAPAILCGVVAGATGRWLRAGARDAVARDLEYLFRPLAACLLVIVGARLSLSDTVLLLAALQTALALMVHRVSRRGTGHARLPGLLATAVAVDAARGLDAGLSPLVDATIISVIALQAAAALLVDRDAPSADTTVVIAR